MQLTSPSAFIDQYSVGNAMEMIWNHEIDGGSCIYEYPFSYYVAQHSLPSAISQSDCDLFNHWRLYWSDFSDPILGTSAAFLTTSTADLQLAGETANKRLSYSYNSRHLYDLDLTIGIREYGCVFFILQLG